jgi:DNA-binding transcriptional ArsR family regulator
VANAGLNPALAELLGRLRDGGVEAVPAGWHTVTAMAALWGISISTARYHLTRLVAAGLAEMRVYRVRCGRMATADIHHYRLLA